MSNGLTGVWSYELELGERPILRPREAASSTGPARSGVRASHYRGQVASFTLAGWGKVRGTITGSTRRQTELGLRFELVFECSQDTFHLSYEPLSRKGDYVVDPP